jgi:hypothetical protein
MKAECFFGHISSCVSAVERGATPVSENCLVITIGIVQIGLVITIGIVQIPSAFLTNLAALKAKLRAPELYRKFGM